MSECLQAVSACVWMFNSCVDLLATDGNAVSCCGLWNLLLPELLHLGRALVWSGELSHSSSLLLPDGVAAVAKASSDSPPWPVRVQTQVPFTTMLALLCMWFGISLPLVYLGYYFGFRKQPYDNPVRTNQIPRQVPEQRWYMNKFVG